MLTLGLAEGVLSATIGLLVLVGAANENAPLHRIFGPIVVTTVGLAAYMAHDAGAMHSPSDAAGLAFFAIMAFFVPLAVMRAAWKAMKATVVAPAEKAAAVRRAATIEELPVEPTRKVA